MTGAQSSFPGPNDLTSDQQQQLFNMQLKQLEDENKRKENEQNLRLKQMEEEHTIKIEALHSTVRGSGGSKQHKSEDKLKSEVLKVSKSLLNMSRTLLLNILKAKFDPYNLYKLRVIHSDDNNNK